MYTLPRLPYDYLSLEPSISRDIMELHHTKHHQTYIDKLNSALDGQSIDGDLDTILSNLDNLPEDIRTDVRNNGGGHLNHSMFWQCMSPESEGQPGGHLAIAMEKRYGDFQSFVDEFSKQATGLFGSGWVWLMPTLDIVTTANQDNPIMHGQPKPILGLDVWEHAYYLDYKNQRDRYIASWWHVVNWAFVEEAYIQSQSV